MKMKKTAKNARTNNMAVIEEVGNQEWRFAEIPYETEMKFNDLLEARDYGNVSPAEMERQLRELLHEAPNFIDVYHHLAMLLDQRGKGQEAQLLWQQAVNIGMQCFIEQFSAAGNKLEWGWLENRPFLRAYHSLGLQHMESGNTEMALSIFRTIMSLNPGDNQGVRALVVDCCLKLKMYKDVLTVCKDSQDDHMAETVYGRVLALFALKRMTSAEKALRQALTVLPLVAAEIVKARHPRPKNMDEGRYTVGGADQAWYYWQEAGEYWVQVPGAIEFVREVLKGRG
ncbi:MAG: tetratricopeptide repeat protein [Desulfuromonadales bacterium]|nr:tetratricopeptide repeat protein [Desulfuromonadales bacterium]